MNTAKVFQTGRSQAVRMPKEYRFDTDEVSVNRIGDMVILFPRDKGWELLSNAIGQFTADFGENLHRDARSEKRRGL